MCDNEIQCTHYLLIFWRQSDSVWLMIRLQPLLSFFKIVFYWHIVSHDVKKKTCFWIDQVWKCFQFNYIKGHELLLSAVLQQGIYLNQYIALENLIWQSSFAGRHSLRDAYVEICFWNVLPWWENRFSLVTTPCAVKPCMFKNRNKIDEGKLLN